MNERILVVEDDSAILTGIRYLFESEGYTVDIARDGTAALERFRAARPDLVLLDIMIPKMNGYDVCREIRVMDRVTPVVMLTAKGQEIDKVIGLELGADDYIVKPFGIAELLARVHSALRRGALASSLPRDGGKDSGLVTLGSVELDLAALRGRKPDGTDFPLTPKEAALLRFLLAHEGRVVDRNTLLEDVWGISCEVTTRTVDQHVVRLRQKIENDPSEPRHLLTAYGAGYRLVR
jgi:DNA-binding response OmpR family regulator